MGDRLRDLRCDGTRQTGPHAGITCRYLLCRIDPNLTGAIETKCPRCNQLRLWTFGLVAVST